MIKTFPLRFDKEYHEQLKNASHDANKSMHQYVLDAINEKIIKDKESNSNG